jgi:hypothetical protein
VLNGVIVSIAFISLSGCASIQLPPDRMQQFDASVRSAQEAGALERPDAQGRRGALGMTKSREHFELAQDQAEVAKALAAAGDSRAVAILSRAQSDIDLSIGLEREAQMHLQARRASDDMNYDR